MSRTPGAPCWDCLRSPPPYCRAVVAMPYISPYDGLIGLLKHHHKLWMAECLARLLTQAMSRQAGGDDGNGNGNGNGDDNRNGNGSSDNSIIHSNRGRGPVHRVSERPALPYVDSALTLLLPIPASRASLMRRGFNPAGELARALGRRLDVPVRHGLLVRTREGPKQSELGRVARLRESVDLFVARSPLSGQHIGLVDDVMTTGGTLGAATHALLDQGAASVSVLVAARTP